MPSKATIKLINSLSVKKYRDEYKLFVAEGEKLVNEIISSPLRIKYLYFTTDSQMQHHPAAEIVSEAEMKKISHLKTPSTALAVVEIPQNHVSLNAINNSLTLALDNIQDPGNLGTIIRMADWFGIKHIICSHHTADCYNPKTIQATMGAITRVEVIYTDLPGFLNQQELTVPVYGTFLDGNNIYTEPLNNTGIIVMGNEGQGISKEVELFIQKKITIPSFSTGNTSESLNVAVATAIICSEFRRRSV